MSEESRQSDGLRVCGQLFFFFLSVESCSLLASWFPPFNVRGKEEALESGQDILAAAPLL